MLKRRAEGEKYDTCAGSLEVRGVGIRDGARRGGGVPGAFAATQVNERDVLW